jgi:sugar O-acyltransferase (sialic acid O-acetyltransferase NeuD family)
MAATGGIRPVAVFGGRGGGSYAAMVLRRIEAAGGPYRFAGLLNDTVAPGNAIGSDNVLGPFSSWSELPPETMFLAPLQKVKEIRVRAERVERLAIPDLRWATVVDPAAIVAPDASLGRGCFVAPNAIVMPQASIGRHVAIRHGCGIGHDAVVDDWCMFAPGSMIAGYVRTGTGAHLGIGAIVRENLSVGRFSVVGMGAIVVRDVPDFTIVAGNPARNIGEIARSADSP